MDNDYSTILGMMRDEGRYFNETSVVLGTVVSPLPNIKVSTRGGLILDKTDLLIDKWIVDRQNVEPTCSDALSTNDNVLMAIVGDVYVITSKVVSI